MRGVIGRFEDYKEMKVQSSSVNADSKLVANQINGNYESYTGRPLQANYVIRGDTHGSMQYAVEGQAMKHRNTFKADVPVWKREVSKPLTTSRAQDLVYIHNNLRLLSRNPNDDVKMWDVGGDAFESMEDVGFLEFADLSLDEPEFENDLIIDN
ncbi:hypothetical protein Tco_0530155 [Tanacetum coccineum]